MTLEDRNTIRETLKSIVAYQVDAIEKLVDGLEKQIEDVRAEKPDTMAQTPEHAINILCRAFKEDPGFAHTWHANIASSVYDSCLERLMHIDGVLHSDMHTVGNEAATRFMIRTFGVKIQSPTGMKKEVVEDSSDGVTTIDTDAPIVQTLEERTSSADDQAPLRPIIDPPDPAFVKTDLEDRTIEDGKREGERILKERAGLAPHPTLLEIENMSNEDLLQFAKDSRSQNIYQQGVIDDLEHEKKTSLSPSEAIYAFVAWLTSRSCLTEMSSSIECCDALDRVVEFCKTNKFEDPRSNYTKLFTMPDESSEISTAGRRLTAVEAVYGFVAWLTTRKYRTVMGRRHDSAPAAERVAEFCEANNLGACRDNWPDGLFFPGKKDAVGIGAIVTDMDLLKQDYADDHSPAPDKE